MKDLTIGQLAGMSKVSVHTLRYYERQGLIPLPPRKPSGYRVYKEETVKRVLFIKNAQRLGFSLNEISELLMLRVDSTKSCSEVNRRTERKIADISEKIQALEGIRSALLKLKAKCEKREPTSPCPVIEELDADSYLMERPPLK